MLGWCNIEEQFNQRSHMAYPISAETPHVGTGRCPDKHPVAIP